MVKRGVMAGSRTAVLLGDKIAVEAKGAEGVQGCRGPSRPIILGDGAAALLVRHIQIPDQVSRRVSREWIQPVLMACLQSHVIRLGRGELGGLQCAASSEVRQVINSSGV